GLAGLQDRSSRPEQFYRPTPQPVIDRIEALRRQRLTDAAIAAETGVSAATVSRVFKRLGLNKLSAPDCRSNNRGVGWEFVHVCIDDASRIAFTEIKPGERKRSAVAFLKADVIYYASLGVAVE